MPWLALGYPLLAHLGVWLNDRRLQCVALVWLLFFSLFEALRQRRLWAWVVLIAGSTALCALTLHGGGLYALYVPPVLIPSALFFLFATSLREGSKPLVTRFAETMRGEPLPVELITYTRHITILWCWVSVALMLSAIGTALWASPETWSLVTNLVHYLVLGAVFLIEFIYRRARYGHLEPWGFLEYFKRLGRIRLRN